MPGQERLQFRDRDLWYCLSKTETDMLVDRLFKQRHNRLARITSKDSAAPE